ncbi:MAG: C40 family peptidase [Candidatus Micrarchaeota archaeon]|nr:C40 family peptidase [Candidatus Micrarchaeota archaeon]
MREKGKRRRSVFIISSIFLILAMYSVFSHRPLQAHGANATDVFNGNESINPAAANYSNSSITPLVASGPNYCGTSVSCSGAPPQGSGASSASETCSFSTCYPHSTSSFSESVGPTTDISPATKADRYNINNNGWLVTCPSTPEMHPQDQSWIDTEIYSFIAGNACQAPSSSLKTSFQFQSSSSSSSSQLATTQVSLQVSNPADVGISELSFSPQVNGYISTTYSNWSYIFRHFPTDPQSVSWYWYGRYANFFNVDPSKVPPLYIGPLSLTYQDPNTKCTYDYTYSSTTTLDSIQNTYIPFTEVLPPDVYYPIQQAQSSSQNPPYMAPDAPSSTKVFNANVYPYFIQQFNITNPAVPPNSLGFSQAYDIYGPWLYYSPYNTIEPFPLDSNSLLYANYNNNLVSFMRDSVATPVNYHNAMQTNAMGANTLQIANIIYDIGGPGSGAGSSGGGGGGNCPNQDYSGDQSTALSFQQVEACAQQAGFSGTDMEIIVSIAYAESSFHPGECYQGQSPCPSGVPAGLLQTGSSTGDTSGYSPSSCSTGASSWWFNPLCEMQFAYVYTNDPINANCPGPVTGHKFCYWQTYGDPAAGEPIGSYCKYMPVGYVGDNCPPGQAQNAAGWWTGTSGSTGTASSSSGATPTSSPDSVAGIPSGYIFALIGAFSGTPTSGQQAQSQTGSAAAVYQAALTQLGVPYCFGGETPKGQDPFCKNAYTNTTSGSFDCSGLVQWAAAQAGFTISRTSEDQYKDVTPIQQSDTVPGDLIFFAISGDSQSPPNHVAICANVGCTQMVEAPYTSQYVRQVPVSADCQPSWCSVYAYGRISGASAGGGSVGTGSGEIDIMRIVNHGYYNTSQYQPTSVQSVSLSSNVYPPPVQQANKQWQQNWQTYWNNVIQIQNGQTYVVGRIPISEIASAIDLTPLHLPSGTKATYQPYNISADNAGDVFIIGSVTATFELGASKSYPFIARVSNTIGPGKTTVQARLMMDCYQGQPTSSNNCKPLQADSSHLDNIIAASPIGDLVFVSGWYDKSIHVMSGSNLGYLGKDISLDYANDLSAVGGQSGLIDVNVAKWLANGGLYGVNVKGSTANDKLMAQIISQASDIYTYGSLEGYTNTNACGWTGGGCAVPITHHPLGITDINGYLYVMDNWLGQLDLKCEHHIFSKCIATKGYVDFDLVMLRVMNSTGVDVPISPTQFNDLGAGSFDNVKDLPTPAPDVMPTYPPYGWVLSANVSAEHASYKLNLCSGTYKDNRCSLPDPSEYKGYYMPLGPHLEGWKSVGVGCTFLFCLYHIAKPKPITGVSFSTSFNETIALLLPDPKLLPNNQETAHTYGELLIAQFDPENYSRAIGAGGPPKLVYACYTDSQEESLGASGNPLSCFYDQQMQQITGPVYLMDNPFRAAEGIGSTTTLTFEEYYGSAFSGTAGYPQQLQDNPQQYINQNLAKYISNLPNTINQAKNAPFPSAQNVPELQATAINAIIYGYLNVPFNYTYTVSQTYDTNSASAASCKPLQHDATSYYIVYTSAKQDAKSNAKRATVEAGSTYVKYFLNYSYYVANVSAATLPPTVITDLLTNRLFGDIYVNQTLNKDTNMQELVNAIMLNNYNQHTFTQGQYPGFSNISSKGIIPPCTGTQCAIQADTAKTASSGGLISTFSFVPQSTDSVAALFTWYREFVRPSQITLAYNGVLPGSTEKLYGYHRIVYALKDRFNNTIFMPIDADIANITQMNMTVKPVVDPKNANRTTIYINGTAYWSPPLSSQSIPLQNGDIYVYFTQNLDYANYNPTNPSTSGGISPKQGAQLCAFGDNALHPDLVPSDCALANPIWTGREQNAQVVTYHPSYNALGQCAPPPRSLLQPIKPNCNIYGSDGKTSMPALCPANPSGYQQYCVPLFNNGTGLCTSEVGLMGIAKTDSKGFFSMKQTVCGYGGAVAGVSYYGTPPPEPVTVRQSDLLNSSDPGSTYKLNFKAFNYTWTPQGASQSFEIGELLLSYGDLNAAYLAIGMAAIAVFMLLKSGREKRVKRRA